MRVGVFQALFGLRRLERTPSRPTQSSILDHDGRVAAVCFFDALNGLGTFGVGTSLKLSQGLETSSAKIRFAQFMVDLVSSPVSSLARPASSIMGARASEHPSSRQINAPRQPIWLCLGCAHTRCLHTLLDNWVRVGHFVF